MSPLKQPLLNGSFFHWRNGVLHVEEVAVDNLCDRWGTPLFVYSKAAIVSAISSYRRGLTNRDHRICYAMKANSNLAILQLLSSLNCGFDIVSSGELDRALAIGANPGDVIFSGVGKSTSEIRAALRAGIGCFNVESIGELRLLDRIANEERTQAPVSIRVNPDIDPKTHPYISTGLKGNKFGIGHREALDAYRLAKSLPNLKIVGIDCHIGSQITELSPYQDALGRILDLIEVIEESGINIHHIDFGGGLGIDYSGQSVPTAEELWRSLLEIIDRRGHGHRRIMIEPGRSIVGNSGICITQVLFVKNGDDKNFCVVDAAMNDLPRPAMYQAFHAIEPVRQRAASAVQAFDVVGPICESGDWIGRDRRLAVDPGDRLAVFSAGAYCMSMASNYNTRGRAAEVLVDGQTIHLIRERESSLDTFRHERLLPMNV